MCVIKKEVSIFRSAALKLYSPCKVIERYTHANNSKQLMSRLRPFYNFITCEFTEKINCPYCSREKATYCTPSLDKWSAYTVIFVCANFTKCFAQQFWNCILFAKSLKATLIHINSKQLMSKLRPFYIDDFLMWFLSRCPMQLFPRLSSQ